MNITADTIDLRINKTGPNPPTVVVGQSYNFNLSATNIGTVAYTGPMEIKEIVPFGMSVTNIGQAGWTCSPSASSANPVVGVSGGTTITCTRNNPYTPGDPLAPNQSTGALTVTARVTEAGTIDNTAEVNLPEPLTGPPIGNLRDSNLLNNRIVYSMTSATAANSADVTIDKRARFGTVNAGDPQIFDVEIINNSLVTTSLGMTMRDELKDLINSNPMGPTSGLVSVDSSNRGVASPITCTGTFSGRSYNQVCEFDSLPPCVQGSTCPIITTTIRPGWYGGNQSNTAIISSSATPDPIPSNNFDTVTFSVTAYADMIVTKTGTPGSVRAGEELLYTITARNNQTGLTVADNVTISDTLPANLTFISAVPSTGSCTTPGPGTVTGSTSNNQITCNLGTISLNTQQTVLVRVRPNQILRNTTLSNTAAVTSTTGDPNPGNNTSLPVLTPVNDPSFDLLVGKTQSINPVTVGDNTVYTLTVQNSGLSAAENVIVTDTLPGSLLSYQSISAPGANSCTTPPVNSLVGTISCTYPFLTPGQIRTVQITMRAEERGSVVNRADVSATDSGPPRNFDTLPGNNTATLNTTVRNRVDLLVTKTPSTGTPLLGEAFNFTIQVTNKSGGLLGEADAVTLTDNLPSGMVLAGAPVPSAPPGTSTAQSCTGATGGTSFTCNFGTMISGGVITVVAPMRVVTLTSTPQTFTNTAVATTTSGEQTPGDNSGSGQVTVTEPGGIAVVKTANPTAIPSAGVGNTITYTFQVTNTGSVPLTNVTLTDPMLGLSQNVWTIGDLASNATATVTGTYAVTQTNLNAGQVVNTAEVTGRTPLNVLVSASAGAVVPLTPTVAIAVRKTADASLLNTPTQVNDRINYSFLIKNTGTVPLTSVTLTDPLLGMTPNTWPVGTLAAGQETTVTGFYLVKQEDLNAGRVRNQATVTGTPPVGEPISDPSGPTLITNEETVVPLTTTASIAVSKTADASLLSTPAESGNQITYTFEIRNTGTVTLTNVTLTDNKLGAVLTGSPIPTLAPGATDTTTYSATYAVTQDDLNAGQVVNTATVEGQTPLGATVTASAGAVVPLTTTAAIAVAKTASPTAINPARVGDLITYNFLIKNTGTVTLNTVTLNDPLPGMTPNNWSVSTLAPGAEATRTGTYAVQQEDLNRGKVENQAKVFGTPLVGPVEEDLSGNNSLTDDTFTEVLLTGTPGVAVVKTANPTSINPAQAGDRITYSFQITNTGSLTLTNVTLSDPLPGLTMTGGPIAVLPPGVTDTTTYTATYSVTEADISAGQVINQATVTANPPTGPPVTDLSGATPGDDTKTVVLLANTPDVTATKTASTDRVILGDSLTYTLTFTSNTPGTLRDVTVIDVLPPGLVYTPGTATAGGVAAEPQVTGRTLRWTGQTIAQTKPLTVRLGVRVTGAAPWGRLENQTWLDGAGGARFSNIATAVIVLEPEAVFDCADIIGKVFNDRNGNGTQDAPDGAGDSATEPGVPAVRVVTTRGYVITTDEFGRFHVPCAELPRDMGSNFTVKLDTRSLPAGFRVTTENPRTIRVTPGKMAKVNFGVSLTRVVRIDLSAQAFTAEGQPSSALKKGIAGLVAQLQSEPSVLRLTYRLSGEGDATARQRLDRVEALVRGTWQGKGDGLRIERRLQRVGGTP